MNRVIITPAVLPSAALAELKQWLGITTSRDDAALLALLHAGLELFEAFTGQTPVEAVCEEMVPASSGWHCLATRPVLSIAAADAVSAEGIRTPLDAAGYELDLDTAGAGRIHLSSGLDARRVALRFTAGLAPDWDALPNSIRHGILRLAAHQHRERESEGAAPLPPASVAALWRPWRRMRLA